MIKLQSLAGVFLQNNGKYLLMKRADNRKIAPGVWSGIGGHMEPNEINDPVETCYREIEEESGIKRNNITALNLLYIITCRKKDKINHIYVFFGETSQTDVINTDEGELFWISKNELLNREYSKTYTNMLRHYINRAQDDRAIYVGVADNDKGRLRMNWSRCEDYTAW